jgi:hypothetical protein
MEAEGYPSTPVARMSTKASHTNAAGCMPLTSLGTLTRSRLHGKAYRCKSKMNHRPNNPDLQRIKEAFAKFWKQVELCEFFDHENHALIRNRDLQVLKETIEKAGDI